MSVIWMALTTACLSAALCGLWIVLARRRGWVDQPGERRSHNVATPRGGGVAIALACATTIIFWPNLIDHDLMIDAWINEKSSVLISLAAICLLGLIDDLRALPAPVKLIGQALALLPMVLSVPVQPAFGSLTLAVSSIIALSLVNIWNFMDGINGIAATQAILVLTATVLGFSTGPATSVYILISAALAGFLPFNFPSAKLFLGDSGSLLVGAAIAAQMLRSGIDVDVLSWSLVACSAFLIDATATLVWRIWHGQNPLRAHREHLYQWAVRCGYSHSAVCLAYATWTTIIVAACWKGREQISVVTVIAVYVAGLLLWLLFRKWFQQQLETDK